MDVQGFHSHWKAWRMKILINPGIFIPGLINIFILQAFNKSSLIQSSDFIFFIGQPHLQETGTTEQHQEAVTVKCNLSQDFSSFFLHQETSVGIC